MKGRNAISGHFFRAVCSSVLGLFFCFQTASAAPVPGGTLDPTSIPKYEAPLVIPPVMPKSGTSVNNFLGFKLELVDVYRIASRQFEQQVLPPGFPKTTVWGYGSIDHPGTVAEGGTFNYPGFTIETKYKRPSRVQWINDLVDADGEYLPHLFKVDQTLHWANPPGGTANRDSHSMDPEAYTGPVPNVVHVHGARVTEESDGGPEIWYLPNAVNIPSGYATTGTFYDYYNTKYGLNWLPGSVMAQYGNDQPATTLWYHDHVLGMTRLNVYAGLAGFYLVRGGPDDCVRGILPGPAPKAHDRAGKKYYEIPILVQDRSFNEDGALFYAPNRAFFEGLTPGQLDIPFIPDMGFGGMSDVSPIWNPEFFGNVMVVNGRTWPYLEVEQRRYRIRFLDGCDARTLMLRFDNDMPFYQIGNEGGFLPAPVKLTQLLVAPAERADVIVDFTDIPAGTSIILRNLAPDYPYQGGAPVVDFPVADADTTGQVMQFRVVPRTGFDCSSPPMSLRLPVKTPLPAPVRTRKVTLNELDSATVFIKTADNGSIEFDPASTVPFGPTESLLGTLNESNMSVPLHWSDAITENPGLGDTETWEIYNFTEDAHPIHLHLVHFEVLNRQKLVTDSVSGIAVQPAQLIPDAITDPSPWEAGFKDTVIVYPGSVTRIKATFDIEGFYVWHCHIIEHEDNEMMRPMHVGEIPADAPH